MCIRDRDEDVFRDEFFTNITLHNKNGKNIMLLGLDVLPEYRGQGLAREIMERYLAREKGQGRKRVILTCLDEKEMCIRDSENCLCGTVCCVRIQCARLEQYGNRKNGLKDLTRNIVRPTAMN